MKIILNSFITDSKKKNNNKNKYSSYKINLNNVDEKINKKKSNPYYKLGREYIPYFGNLKDVQLSDSIKRELIEAESVQVIDNASVNNVFANSVFVSSSNEIKKINANNTTLVKKATIQELTSPRLNMSNDAYIYEAESKNILMKDNSRIDKLTSDEDINIIGRGKIGEIKTNGNFVVISGLIEIADTIKFIKNRGLVVLVEDNDKNVPNITEKNIYNGDLIIIDSSIINPVCNLEQKIESYNQEKNENLKFSTALTTSVNQKDRNSILRGRLAKNFINNDLELLTSEKELKPTLSFVQNKKIGDKNLTDFWFELLNKEPKSLSKDEKIIALKSFTQEQKAFLVTESLKEYEDNVLNKEFTQLQHKDLPIYENELEETQQYLKKATININDIKYKEVGGRLLVDIMLDEIEGHNASLKYRETFKIRKLEKLLTDPEKVQKAINKALGTISLEVQSVKVTRAAYSLLLEETPEFTVNQKKMLKDYQDSKIFYSIVADSVKDKDDIDEVASNIENITEELVNEEKLVKEKTNSIIFEPLLSLHDNSGMFNIPESKEKINLIYSILAEKVKNEDPGVTKITEANIKQYKKDLISNPKNASISWQKLVVEARNYYNTKYMEDFTSNNIKLLSSISNNLKNGAKPAIMEAINSKKFNIAEQEFIARYKDDKNIEGLLSDTNIFNKQSEIEDLLNLESINKKIMQNNLLNFEHSVSLYNISECQELIDKYLEALDIDTEDKSNSEKAKIMASIPKDELKIATEKIYTEWIDKELKPYISNQAVEKIRDQDPYLKGIGSASNNINNLAFLVENSLNTIAHNQSEQIVQLNKMNNQLSELVKTTANIEKNTQAIVRMNIVELEKNKYFKSVVPDIVELLPKDEQISVGEFLRTVDIAAKKEKNAKRRQKILIAGLIAAGIITAGAAVYYAGPAIVGHLASGLPSAITSMSPMLNYVSAQSNIASQVRNFSLLNSSGAVSFCSEITDKYKAWCKNHTYRSVRLIADKISDYLSVDQIKDLIRAAGGSPPSF